MMTGTTVTRRLVGSAWPPHFNKVDRRGPAEKHRAGRHAAVERRRPDPGQGAAERNRREGGRLEDESGPARSRRSAPRTEQGGSDDIGDISWNVPTVYLRYPANIPKLPGHSWADAVAMATPIAHKGSTAGAKVQAMTALDFLLSPGAGQASVGLFHKVQTKDQKYTPLIAPDDQPAI